GYRSILPHGVYPAALLFVETPLEEVDVNVHPAKTEVRFRRPDAVADAVREAVKKALASAGFTAREPELSPQISTPIESRVSTPYEPRASTPYEPQIPEVGPQLETQSPQPFHTVASAAVS